MAGLDRRTSGGPVPPVGGVHHPWPDPGPAGPGPAPGPRGGRSTGPLSAGRPPHGRRSAAGGQRAGSRCFRHPSVVAVLAGLLASAGLLAGGDDAYCPVPGLSTRGSALVADSPRTSKPSIGRGRGTSGGLRAPPVDPQPEPVWVPPRGSGPPGIDGRLPCRAPWPVVDPGRTGGRGGGRSG